MSRAEWNDYFLDIAQVVSSRATCDRLHVGAVLVKDKRIIATGYNGSPSGLPHCNDVGHLMIEGHCVRTIHAEQNALFQCSKYGVSTEGATCYVTHFPCLLCTKSLIQSGVEKVVYRDSYRIDKEAVKMLALAGVQLEKR